MPVSQPKNFDCVAAAERMHEFLDGELAVDLRLAMERHLASCADCAKTFAQLRQLENAHRQLDAQLEPPAEDYWQALPQRVMERVKASEKRRLLTLPKLPRFKSAAHRAPAAEKPPTSDLLHLPPAVQKFLQGSAKYVLPLAAVATFCFFMIRELREKPAATVMMESPKMTAEREAAPEPSTPATTDEAPAKKSITAPSELATGPQTPISLQNIPLTATGQAGAGGGRSAEIVTGQSSGAAVSPILNTKAGESLSGLASTTTSAEAKIERDSLVAIAFREAEPSRQIAVSSEKAKDQPTGAAEQADLSVDKLQAEKRGDEEAAETRALDDTRTRSTRRYSRQPSTSGRVGISTLQKSAASDPAGSGFAETLQRAQQTTELKKREKIWRDFLKSDPDSSYRALAVSHLAQTLAAASDSTTKLDQLEKNLAYFQDNAATLRPLMGAQQFERELARLQMLVNRRKASSKQ